MLVQNPTEYATLTSELAAVSAAGGTVAVDTETTGLSLYCGDTVRGISVSYRLDGNLRSWYLPVSHPDSENADPAPLVRALNAHKGLQVFHHADFDWAALVEARTGYVIPEGRFHDTQVADWLQDENVRHGLKPIASRLFGEDAASEQRDLKALKAGRKSSDIYRELRAVEPWNGKGMAKAARIESQRLASESKKSWDTFTADDIADYAARDTDLTLMVMESQVGPFGSSDPVLQRELKLQPVLYRMIKTGIAVNEEAAIRQGDIARARLAELSGKFPDGVTLASTPQVAKLVYEDWGIPVKHFTKSGGPSTEKTALEEHMGDPRIRDLLEVRGLQKALGTYYGPLLSARSPDDGRIHASFSSTRTKTGRLACSAPNLMTIPRGDTLHGVRDVFEPAPGYELWEYDIVSAEVFFMASFSGDPTLCSTLLSGGDLHDTTAAMVFGADFTPLQRRLAKNLNYGFPYGIGAKKFATYMVAGSPDPVTSCYYWEWERWDNKPRPGRCRVCHVCQAADILQGFREAYPRLVALMSGLEKMARKRGVLELHVPGRYRHFKSPGVQVPYRNALNSLVQGGVAEFQKDMMLLIEPELVEVGARLCLQVHDSFVIEVQPGTGQLVGDIIKTISDEINPLDLPISWSAGPWAAHD